MLPWSPKRKNESGEATNGGLVALLIRSWVESLEQQAKYILIHSEWVLSISTILQSLVNAERCHCA